MYIWWSLGDTTWDLLTSCKELEALDHYLELQGVKHLAQLLDTNHVKIIEQTELFTWHNSLSSYHCQQHTSKSHYDTTIYKLTSRYGKNSCTHCDGEQSSRENFARRGMSSEYEPGRYSNYRPSSR